MADAASVRLVCDAGVAIGESPAWRDDGVYWTDPVSRRLLSVATNGELHSVAMTSSVWSLATLPDGRWSARSTIASARSSKSGEISAGPAATIDRRLPLQRHDGRCARWAVGRHDASRHSRDTRRHLPCDAQCVTQPTRVASGLGVPNGMKVSADGRTLFVIDTLERTLLAYPIDRRRWASPSSSPIFSACPESRTA